MEVVVFYDLILSDIWYVIVVMYCWLRRLYLV